MLGQNTAEIRGANFDETETPTVLVNGQALESVVATDSSALTLTMPPAEEAGAVTVRVVNSDGQSDTVTYTYLEDVADPPLYESINRTTFEVGDASQTLIAEFSQVQEPYRLTVTPLLTSGGFPSFNNGTLTYIHDDPCVDGVGPYVIEVANPDGQDANVAYYCAPAPEPQVTLQAKGWLYTQSGGDQLMVFGSNLHLVEKTEIRPVDDPNTSTVLCDGDCDFESNEAVVATPNDLTPDAFYEVVFRWTSPYDENQIAYWVSNPLFAGAPKAISASELNGRPFQGLDLAVTGNFLNGAQAHQGSCQLYWYDSIELNKATFLQAFDEGMASDGGVNEGEEGTGDLPNQETLAAEDFSAYCGCTTVPSGDGLMALQTVRETCRLIPGHYFARITYPTGHTLDSTRFVVGADLTNILPSFPWKANRPSCPSVRILPLPTTPAKPSPETSSPTAWNRFQAASNFAVRRNGRSCSKGAWATTTA